MPAVDLNLENKLIPMARFFPHRDFWCGNCGLVVYKSVLGEHKITHLQKEFTN